jgi:hypothetical protein
LQKKPKLIFVAYFVPIREIRVSRCGEISLGIFSPSRDVFRGVRAAVIDKHADATWKPSRSVNDRCLASRRSKGVIDRLFTALVEPRKRPDRVFSIRVFPQKRFFVFVSRIAARKNGGIFPRCRRGSVGTWSHNARATTSS